MIFAPYLHVCYNLSDIYVANKKKVGKGYGKKYELGDVLTGKVTGIQPYGAFVALDDNTQGLVHISEITYGFVKDVSEF